MSNLKAKEYVSFESIKHIAEDMPTPTRSITEIEREQIKKLKKSKSKLMLDE